MSNNKKTSLKKEGPSALGPSSKMLRPNKKGRKGQAGAVVAKKTQDIGALPSESLDKEELLPLDIEGEPALNAEEDYHGTLLPALPQKELTDPFTLYMREVQKYPLLSPEQEKVLTKALAETGDLKVAQKLVLANLRLVVKIAMEYKKAHQNIMDLIQEGNIGLMKAVSKYDGTKGAKLSYYASWWIRSYILKFILDNFRLVKIATTREQKKLFYNLMREKERLMTQGLGVETKLIGENLGVSEKAVEVMDLRLSSQGRESSLDASVNTEGSGGGTLADLIPSEDIPIEESLGQAQEVDILKNNLQKFLEGLKKRDREIFTARLLEEVPPSLQALADRYGVSRERIRQIEERLLKKLKVYMAEFIR